MIGHSSDRGRRRRTSACYIRGRRACRHGGQGPLIGSRLAAFGNASVAAPLIGPISASSNRRCTCDDLLRLATASLLLSPTWTLFTRRSRSRKSGLMVGLRCQRVVGRYGTVAGLHL